MLANDAFNSATTRTTLLPRLLHQCFERQARRRPNHHAVEFAGETITYAELDRLANRYANHFRKKGLKVGDLVGIYLRKSPRLYATMLGILKAGGAYVPIDPKFPLDRIQAITDDAHLRFIVTEGDLASALMSGVRVKSVRLDFDKNIIAAESPQKAHDVRQRLMSSDLCYVIYTSGSTGRPKGVMIEHRNAVAFVDSLDGVYRVSQNDRVYQGFSTAFDASVEEIWAAFARGGTLVVPTEDVERSPSDVAEFINKNGITYYSTVPTMLAMIDRELPSLKTLVLGGEACSNELVTRWAKPSLRMLNTYGPTEATVVATWSECVAGKAVTIGRPLPRYRAYVLDENQQQVAPGESGELYIGGEGVGRGYMNLPDMTDEKFIPNPFDGDGRDRLYRTYDHVRLGEDGELYFLGRLDDQVKIRGFRIELSEIESVLLDHPLIKAAAVAVTEVSQMKELAAYIVLTPGADTLDREQLAELLRRRVPPYMVPKYLDIVGSLPTSTSGKIDRKNLPTPQSLLRGLGDIVAPEDELEEAIAESWRQGFKLPEISVESDFFVDLGGHSLLAAQCINRLRISRGIAKVSVRDIYDHRTVRGLAKVLRERGDIGAAQGGDAGESNAEKVVKELPAQKAFSEVSKAQRTFTVAVQALVSMIYYGIIASPIAYMTVMASAVIHGTITWKSAAFITTALGFAAWPALLLLSISVKWLVIGRFKEGRYPLWGSYYLRWWIVNLFQSLSWSEMFSGTPLMAFYWRMMGAKIGSNVTIATPICRAFDMVTIGNGSSIGVETQILGYRVEDGYLVIAPSEIGRDCFVGMHCTIGLNARMMDGSALDDMSALADNSIVPPGEGWRGSPARPAKVTLPPRQLKKASPARVAAFAVLHLGLIYSMGYFLLATMLPAMVMLFYGLYNYGPWGGVVAAFASVPVSIITYATLAVAVKRMFGKLEAGSVPIYSARYLKHWFVAYLLENTKNILMPLYATVYLPAFLRLLGAKIGKGTEISTVSHVNPDLLEVGDGSFLADACIVGGQRLNGETLHVETVRIGAKTFIGNSALVSGGHAIGDNSLIGVASTPPMNMPVVPDNTRWLGSPGFALPRTQSEGSFEEAEIFKPSRAAVIERSVTDAARIVLPGLILTATSTTFVTAIYILSVVAPLAVTLAVVPVLAMLLAGVSIVVCAAIKRVFSGYLKPTVQPLWCRFVWHNELVNGVYEAVAAHAMAPLLGTPFMAPFLRLMGCKVGKWCFIETTLFSEFDLVEIGDRACLNLGATVQTHLFEDRVFKADRLRIANDCTVGNMSVVLYSTDMQPGAHLGPLSVLMKGETLPPTTHWFGIPCDPVLPTRAWSETEAAQDSASKIREFEARKRRYIAAA